MQRRLLQPIATSKLSEQVEKQIKTLILTNKLKVGERLPSERELAQQLQVGQRSIREALHLLQTLGFIEIQHGKGAFVTGMRLDNYLESLAESISFRLHKEKTALLQLLEVRKLLEAGIASLATNRATPQDIRIMEKALSRQKEAIQKQDVEVFNIADLDFHYAVVKASQNDILVATYNALSNLMLESIRKTNQLPGAAKESLKHHQNIFLAIKSGNEKLAYRSIFIHIDKIEQDIKKIFK